MKSRIKCHWATALALVAALMAPSSEAGVLYGTRYETMIGRSGHPTSSALVIDSTGYLDATCINNAGPGRRTLIYPFDIPAGFEIFKVEIWGRDASASNDLGYRLVETCQPFLAAGTPVSTNLAAYSTSGSPGEFVAFLFADQHVAISSSCAYYVEARFADDGAACDGYDLATRNVRILLNDPDVIFRDDFGP